MDKLNKIDISLIDSNLPEHYVKMSIKVYDNKNFDNFKGLIIEYCKNGLCEHRQQICRLNFCPYKYNYKLEQPNKKSKKYIEYLKEYNLQMSIKYLNECWDKNVEKALKDELSNKDYGNLINELSLNEKLYSFKLSEAVNYHKIFKDILMCRKQKENANPKEFTKKLFFEINEYYCINIYCLPNIFDKNGKSIWDHLSIDSGWIKKEKFTSEVFKKIISINAQYNKNYHNNIEILINQLKDEFPHLIVLFQLQN